MSKEKNQMIKFVYLTKLDEESFRFQTKRLKVAKECSGYVSLEDGVRIRIGDIHDAYAEEDHHHKNPIAYHLADGYAVYTLKPISKTVKADVRKKLIGRLEGKILANKSYIEYNKQSISNYRQAIETLERRMGTLEDDIAQEEAKLAKLTKE